MSHVLLPASHNLVSAADHERMDIFIKTLSSVLSPYGTNVIVGNFSKINIRWSNVDVLNYKLEHLLSKFVHENGLHQHVFVPTRDTSSFDLVLLANPDIILHVNATVNFSTSDQASIIVFNLNFLENLKYVQLIYTSYFKKANWAGIRMIF